MTEHEAREGMGGTTDYQIGHPGENIVYPGENTELSHVDDLSEVVLVGQGD